MVVVNIQGKEVYMDGFLKEKLDNVKMIIDRNWDCVILIDGKERVGKSTLGMTIGSYLYPKMNVDNIASDSKEATKKLEGLPNKSVLMIDEGSLVFSSKDTMRAEQRQLIKILNVIGQKNMILIIVLPSFFDLNKYIATDRSRFLLHCYSDKKLIRGRFCYFSTGKLRRLYEKGKKNYGSYAYPKANFLGRFAKFEPEWYKEYLKVKEKSLMSALHEDPKAVEIARKIKEYRLVILKNLEKLEPKPTKTKISEILNIHRTTLHKNLKEVGVVV